MSDGPAPADALAPPDAEVPVVDGAPPEGPAPEGPPPDQAASDDGLAPPPAFPKVDELFAGEPPPPPIDVRPRVLRLRLLLVAAVLLDIVGLLLTVVPGAILTVWAWLSADAEVARIEAGTYDEGAVATVVGIRNVARAAMVFCVVCLVGQAWALHNGLYDGIWATLYELVMGIVGRVLG